MGLYFPKIFFYNLLFIFFVCQGCATSAQEISKKRARALEDLGVSYLMEGELNLAVKHLTEAAKADPRDPYIAHSLALAYRDLGVFDRAIAEFRRALALKEDSPQLVNNMGVTYMLMGRLDEAISCFVKAAGTIFYATPHYAFLNLGMAYYQKGDYRRAISYYKKALEVDSSFVMAYENLGLAYEAAGEWQKALGAYKSAISCDAGSSKAYLLLGKFLRRLGRNSEAVVMLRKALNLDADGWKSKEALEIIDKINRKLQ